ncbi:MAG: hypothetical protein NZ455_05150 [Bacteroidia bacterium]|nr:hypothetical protein [Bacteroidia bacterium]MDW8345447.1 hypothetical protein [Bacteroidia bacterium]
MLAFGHSLVVFLSTHARKTTMPQAALLMRNSPTRGTARDTPKK